MGIQGPIPIPNDIAFPAGACAIGVVPIFDFDRSTKVRPSTRSAAS